jgi:hypothetical protein
MEAEKAVEIVNGLYAKWGQDIFDPVSDEFDSKMQQGLTPDLQRRAFYDVKRMFGDYSGMTFYEALTQRFFGGTVYRFKGSFSQGAGNQPEIRVVFDKQGKISGLWIKPWAEEMR